MAFTREDAEKKCMDLGGKQYLEVKWRMVWFRETCPKGTIDTEEIAVDLDRVASADAVRWVDDPTRPGKKKREVYTKTAKGYARYRAIVTDGNGARATGTKSECAANFDDYIEKAETGAIGRALAALGYGTQFTGDELDEGKRIVDSPVPTSNGKALHDLAKSGSYEEHEASGHQESEQAPLTLEDVQWRAKDAGLATSRKDWQFFNAKVFGQFVPDEKLKGDQARLLQLQAAIMQEANAGAGK